MFTECKVEKSAGCAAIKQFLIGPFWRHRFFQAILLDGIKSNRGGAEAGTESNTLLSSFYSTLCGKPVK